MEGGKRKENGRGGKQVGMSYEYASDSEWESAKSAKVVVKT